MTKESDLKALMTASLQGDSIAHRSLLTALSGHLRSYYKSRLLRSGRPAEETEDLVQEALIVIHTQRHTYDPEQPLTPWVYAIARYKLIDHLRRTRTTTAEAYEPSRAGRIAGQAGFRQRHPLRSRARIRILFWSAKSATTRPQKWHSVPR